MNRILRNRFVTSQSAAFGDERLSASADEAAHIERVARSLSRRHYRLHAEDLCLTQAHTHTHTSHERGGRKLEASMAHGIRIDGGKCEPFRQVHQTHVRLSRVSPRPTIKFSRRPPTKDRPDTRDLRLIIFSFAVFRSLRPPLAFYNSLARRLARL